LALERHPSSSEPTQRGRFRTGRVLRLVRRVHMYLGLFLVPWILLFGLSGVLFNHPNLGEQVAGTPVPAAKLRELTGFSAWDPNELAKRIVEHLNMQNGATADYAVDPSVEPAFQGPVILKAEAPHGRHTTLVDVQRGRAFVITRQARPSPNDVPFKQNVPIVGISTKDVEARVSALLSALNLDAKDAPRANHALAPELRFALRDKTGKLFHATYHTGTAQLTGRLAETWSPIGASQMLTALHTTHHFPPSFGFRWAWAFFQDILGLAMAFWAISGLAMWWQLKATRIAGTVSIAFALGLASWITWGTAADLMFGEVMQELGPG
jgi:hypothetical protein